LDLLPVIVGASRDCAALPALDAFTEVAPDVAPAEPN
jgi:hypothetical protein